MCLSNKSVRFKLRKIISPSTHQHSLKSTHPRNRCGTCHCRCIGGRGSIQSQAASPRIAVVSTHPIPSSSFVPEKNWRSNVLQSTAGPFWGLENGGGWGGSKWEDLRDQSRTWGAGRGRGWEGDGRGRRGPGFSLVRAVTEATCVLQLQTGNVQHHQI